MKKKFHDFQNLSVESLQKEVVTCRKAMFHLRLQKRSDASAVKPHHIRLHRRTIAQLKTVLQQRMVSEKTPVPQTVKKTTTKTPSKKAEKVRR